MFSQTTEYALRIIAYLAGHFGESVTTRQISVATKVPESYLSKVIQELSKARLIKSQRGLNSHGVNLCPLHRRLDNALALVEDAFRKSTLADLLNEPSASTPLCENPDLLDDLAARDAAKSKPATLTISARKPRKH